MKRWLIAISGSWLVVLALALRLPYGRGPLHGTVKNGTTGKPAAGVEVILIQLQGGMQPVAKHKTDAQGQFTFDNPGTRRAADAGARGLPRR